MMRQFLAIAAVLSAVVITGCDNEKMEYMNNIREFNRLSTELSAAVARRTEDITAAGDTKYNCHDVTVDSIEKLIVPVYNEISFHRGAGEDYYEIVDKVRLAQIDLFAALDWMKLNYGTKGDDFLDSYNEAQRQLAEQSRELAELLPKE